MVALFVPVIYKAFVESNENKSLDRESLFGIVMCLSVERGTNHFSIISINNIRYSHASFCNSPL